MIVEIYECCFGDTMWKQGTGYNNSEYYSIFLFESPVVVTNAY